MPQESSPRKPQKAIRKLQRKAPKNSQNVLRKSLESLTNNFGFSHYPEQVIYISQEDCILQTPKKPASSFLNKYFEGRW
jgi:hypothetical protein